MIARNPELPPGADRFAAGPPHPRLVQRIGTALARALPVAAPLLLLALSAPARAAGSVAYGSINNFDAVNGTGVVCHGFEIEIDGIHSKDITYTYDFNHYGVPRISEDTTDPAHPRVFVRYESGKNPDGTWAAYTAVPSSPIPPTAGHQFTNPSVNFGGEHFGVGFYGTPGAVIYNWLKDDGAGHLVYAGTLSISTPTFTYIPPPVVGVPVQVQAVIVPPPPPPEIPVMEFGPASWVKETKTSAHNNNQVEIRDLVDDDPANPQARSWRNGEPSEVEVEWQLFQTDFLAGNGGANGEIAGAPEDAGQNGDEVVTRRYDFFKYVGPTDPDTGEALADSVAPDGIHGTGAYAATVVVGDYIGAQMAGFDPAGKLGLIYNLQDGQVNVPYVERSVVIGGTPVITTTVTGALPHGMDLDKLKATGILSGTPTESGTFTFEVHSTDQANGDVRKTYTLKVAPPPVTVTTGASPAAGGTTSGGGTVNSGDSVTVVATPNAGYSFLNWTDGNVIVSSLASYTFTATANRTLIANFTLADTTPPTTVASLKAINGGVQVTLTATDNPGGSGVAGTSYKIDAGVFTAYTGPFTISSTGPHTVRFYSRDKAGNTEATRSVDVTVAAPPPNQFDFTMPGWPGSKLSLKQGSPPVLTFDLYGLGGYHRAGQTPIPTLAGCGTIQSVQVVGTQVVVTASSGKYVSRDGFIYQKVG